LRYCSGSSPIKILHKRKKRRIKSSHRRTQSKNARLDARKRQTNSYFPSFTAGKAKKRRNPLEKLYQTLPEPPQKASKKARSKSKDAATRPAALAGPAQGKSPK
jgi:hypothetical protein